MSITYSIAPQLPITPSPVPSPSHPPAKEQRVKRQARGTAAAVADIAGNSTLFDAARTLADLVDNLRANKDTARQLVRRVNELTCAISSATNNAPAAGDHTSYLQDFNASLESVASCLRKHGKQSYLSQLLYQERNKAELTALAEDIEIAHKKFMVQMRIEVNDSLAKFMQRVDASTALSQVTAYSSTFCDPSPVPIPSYAALHLPPAPQLFFGRDAERRAIAEMISDASQTQFHVALLGGPGIGKTSLALNCMHDDRTRLRFGPNRFFVPCDAATPLVSIIAGSFGTTSSSPGELHGYLVGIFGDAPSLLVVDNFESVWEPAASRADAEEILALLSSMPNVSLIITMRGAERPHGVPWTRPFLPVLDPIGNDAARMTFLSICDPAEPDSLIQQLLDHLGNLPLAVVLMASLAQYESVAALLERWTETSTSMLRRSNGQHRLNSLDMSFAISLQSPRMRQAHDAVDLLSLLALLPRGALAADIDVWASAFSPNALSTLWQNALVISAAGQRLRVQAPLREFILKTCPPSSEVATPLYDHYFAWAAALRKGGGVAVATELAIVAEEVENIESVIVYAIQYLEDPRSALAAGVSMCSLYSYTGIRSASLLTAAMSVARQKQLTEVMAELSYCWAIACWNTDLPGDAIALMEDAKRLYDIVGNVTGAMDASMQLLVTRTPEKAAQEGLRILAYFTEQGDVRRSVRCYREIALAYELGGQMHAAREFYARAVATLRDARVAEDALFGFCILQLAICDGLRGDFPSALALLPQAIRILTAARASQAISEAERLLGDISLLQGDGARAVTHFQRSEEIYSRHGSIIYSLVVAHLAIGDVEGATSAIEKAEKSLSDEPESPRRRWILHARGELALWLEDTAEADAALTAARHITRMMLHSQSPQAANGTNVPEELLVNEAGVLASMGQVYILEGRQDEAFSALLVAAVTWAKFGRTVNAVSVVTQLADAAPDDVADVLLAATIPYLRHAGLQGILGHALVRSAWSRRRCGDLNAAKTLGMGALDILKRIQDKAGCRKVEKLLASFC